MEDIFDQALGRLQSVVSDDTGADRDADLDSHTRYVRAVWRHAQGTAEAAGVPLYVYGAGAHSEWLLSVTDDLPRAHLGGFLDDTPRDRFHELPVLHPEQAQVPDGTVVLLSSDRYEEQLHARAQTLFGNHVKLIRLYASMPAGPYGPPEPAERRAQRLEATRRARQRWGGAEFVGPYERAGYVTGFLEEQWLWGHRARLTGRILDMSTPRHWHEWIHDLPGVQVTISDLEQDVILKANHASPVDLQADFCADRLPVAPGSFDTILCLSILEHCRAPGRLVSNLHSVLAPGGTLLLSTPFTYLEGHCNPDYWRFCKAGLRLLAEEAGFEEIETTSLGEISFVLAEVLGFEPAAGDAQLSLPLLTCMRATKPR